MYIVRQIFEVKIMELVQPIKDKIQIEKFKNVLLENGTRDLLLFVMGINSGLRISDLIPLIKRDVVTGSIKIKEKKTQKVKEFPLNQAILTILNPYIECLNDDDYLFPSRQSNGKNGHITRQQAYNILNKASAKIGIKEQIGTHTLRKTFGYWHYKQFKDVAMLQKIFNHSAPSITLKYIGIEQDEINNSYMNFSL